MGRAVKESMYLMSAVILLLPVVAIAFIDIALVYYQFALAPSVDVKNLVPSAALTNTSWVLDKIAIGGGVVLVVMTVQHLFFTQSMGLFILSAGGLAVHLVTSFIVDPTVVTPFIAMNALNLFG
ncbi:hypothetical protein K5D56_22020 [Pseudomonas cichorii]|nr:hypothetical protein [Pseudomonas cichorii]MBX8557147.1 hypothetical protein [Pseudomonas cichorii]MBX8592046.1 hypothetical protein [Pseudomonas cichorii]